MRLMVRVVMQPTVDSWALRLVVAEGVMRRPWRSVHAWWRSSLHMSWHARDSLLILRWRSKSRSALPCAGHNALEEVGRTVADGWRLWLRRTAVLPS